MAEVRNQLAHVTDQVKCIIDDNEVVERLDHAWLDVRQRLEVCEPLLGCCVDGDDEFDTDIDDYRTEIVKARVAEYEHRTQAAEDCFTKLLGEPGRLTERVTNLQAEVAGIASDVGGDSATTDFKRLYARALVAWRHLDEVWWGFDHAARLRRLPVPRAADLVAGPGLRCRGSRACSPVRACPTRCA